jgi:hypothetical protein
MRWAWSGGMNCPSPFWTDLTATYPDVLPDVDLIVTANPEGFSQALKIKTREAGENPALEEIAYGSHTREVTLSGDADGVEARDAEGKLRFVGDVRMWDSSGADASGEVVAPSGATGQVTMTSDGPGDEIIVRPDRAFLTDPDTQYPVFVDPSYYWAGKTNHHVVVQSGFPTERNFDKRTGVLNDLKAGNAGDASGISRSYVELDLRGVQGKRIKGATLRTRVKHSHGCSGGEGTQLWLTDPISSNTTWDNQPSWKSKLADFNVYNNVEYCPRHGGVDIGLTHTVKGAVANGRSELTFMLKAADHVARQLAALRPRSGAGGRVQLLSQQAHRDVHAGRTRRVCDGGGTPSGSDQDSPPACPCVRPGPGNPRGGIPGPRRGRFGGYVGRQRGGHR